MWIYRIVDGKITNTKSGRTFTGYSGRGHSAAEGRNNPDLVQQRSVGPIPPGDYTIGPPYSSAACGPYTMNLDASGASNTFGRDAFRIHGNNAENDASHGCIILPPDARRVVWESQDHDLRVVRGDEAPAA